MAAQPQTSWEESSLLKHISIQVRGLRAALALADIDRVEVSPAVAFSLLADLKLIQGNLYNKLSALACLAAKEYLDRRFGEVDWNPLGKAMGAAGRDVALTLPTGERLIAEIKTTRPYKGKDFGAQQKQSILKDLHSLKEDVAEYKMFFVTDAGTYKILKKWSKSVFGETELVLLDAKGSSVAQDDGFTGGFLDRANDTADFEFVESGKESSIDRRLRLLHDLAEAYKLAGVQGLPDPDSSD